MVTKVYCAEGEELDALFEKLYRDVVNDFEHVDFLFFAIHPDFEIDSINEKITSRFKTTRFFAFHAVNGFCNTKTIEKGVTLFCVKFEREGDIQTFYVEDIQQESALEETASYLNTHQKSFHIILTGLCDGKISTFIENLSPLLRYETLDNIIGGVSSGNLDANEVRTFQFIDGKVIKNGFTIISFDNVVYNIEVALGFKPYGITYKVSKADGTKLYSVDDGKSASYMARKMLEHIGDSDVRYLWYVPFSLLNSQNGYVKSMRTIADIKDEYVEFFAPIKEGDFFKLSFATPEDLIEEDARTARRVVRKFPSPEAVFDFSCIARQYVLEEKQEEELQVIADVIRKGLFGFFTFGEIGPDKKFKKLTFYNETTLVVGVREK